MSEQNADRPRPTPRPRPSAAGRPSPRPRVAGSRRDREETEAASRPARPSAAPRPRAGHAGARPEKAAGARTGPAARRSAARRSGRPAGDPERRTGGRPRRLAVVLAVACLLAAAGAGLLLWQRSQASFVDPSVFTATRSSIQALYAYDYRDSQGSVARKLDVLTGELRDQYQKDLSQGGIIDTYEQVSATTSYEIVDVGLQQINQAQDAATLVVFGQYVVESVNSGTQPPPSGSECLVTPEGAQSCTQTVRVGVTKVDGTWKIDELTLLTTS